MLQVTLTSRDQFLADLLRYILVNTDITDVSAGSDIGTLAEAIASSLSNVNTNALKILESTNIESLVGPDLDKKAESIKLPNGQGGNGRKPAIQTVGTVKIGSSFSKISSQLYAGKPSPFSGSSVLYLKDAASFPATGSVYIGRGTVNRFEGPVPYSSVVDNGSFWTLTLSTPLTKNHLQSDLVVFAQGGERRVQAGAVVQVPAGSDSPSVQFKTISDIVIPDGEAEGSVNVVCTQFGESGNVLGGAITSFTSAPFSGATVTNPSRFRSGKSSESDEDLRERIKSYPSTLSRGVKSAIQAAIVGATDPDSGRTIQSSVVLEPIEQGDSARVFIDDGTGLEPTIDGKPYELLLASASGQERRFRLSQFPATPAAIQGSGVAPYVLDNTLSLTVYADELTETYNITPSNYSNLLSATAYEVVRDLNSQSNLFGFRTINNGSGIIMMNLSGNAETIRVDQGDWQSILGLTTSSINSLFLYINSQLKSFRGHTATLVTKPRSEWSISASDVSNVSVIVDGVTQYLTLIDADFSEFGTTVATASVSQYASVLSRKIAGVKFTVSGQVLIWSTYQTFSATGSLEIPELKQDGSPAGWIGDSKIWKPATSAGILSDVGYPKDYAYNRFTGEINLNAKPAVGDKIEVGSRSTRAFINSTKSTNGLFTLSPSPSTFGNAKMVVAFDGDFAVRAVAIPTGATVTPTEPDPTNAKNIVRLTANNTSVFQNALVNDSIYLAKDTSIVPTWGVNIEGIYRIKNKGNNFASSNQNYSTLPISVNVDTGVPAQVFEGLSKVVVTKVDHGLKTGDLITVSTATAIGGISSVNLSVVNTPVIVLNQNTIQYVAGASATANASGTLATVGYNTVTVTQALHGFATGASITTSAAAPVGGISAPNLSISGVIDVLDVNSYQYRAASAATSDGTGNLTTVAYLADSWIEFEIDSYSYSDWSALFAAPQNLSTGMVNIFYSTSIPELIDFGPSVSTVTADFVIGYINDTLSGGSAVKLSPQQVQIRSNDYNLGSAAVLVTVGNASNLFTPQTANNIQAHVGYSKSGYLQGSAPVISDVITPTTAVNGYGTRTYLYTDKDLLRITDPTLSNPTVQEDALISDYPEGFQVNWISGKEAGLTSRVYNNQTTAPFPGIIRGENVIKPLGAVDPDQTSSGDLDRYSDFALRMRDLPLNNHDKLVVEMDLDPTDKTVSVPMTKRAVVQDMDAITGSGKGQVISFRLLDPEDSNKPFFNSDSVYKNFDFKDFKLLTKSVGLYRDDISDRALVLRSVDYLSPARLKLSIRLPSEPDQADFIITHTNSFTNSEASLNVIVTLPSQSIISGSLIGAGNYRVTSSVSGNLYDWRISHSNINSAGEYVAGNMLNLGGASNISGSYYIQSANYIVLSGASAAVTNTSNLVTVTSPGHGLLNTDIATVVTASPIGGISAPNLSVAYAQVSVIDANTFTYQALALATSTTSGFLDSITSGSVVVKSPGSGGLSPSTLFDASANPISSYQLLPKSKQDLADALNAYYPDSPVLTAEAIGTAISSNPIVLPTYIAYPPSSPYAGSDLSGAYNAASFSAYRSGSAGVWQYDSSVPSANGIKATVQSDDPVFPTVTDASGTTYNPIGEEVHLVPTNTKTLNDWMNFNAVSSLQILANIERTNSDQKLQIASVEDGSFGTVSVTGVSANSIVTSVVGNATSDGESSKLNVLNADARSLIPNSLVRIQNSISSEILRSYRLLPTGASITGANTTSINTYFRPTNAIKYIKLDTNTARILFLRNGQFNTQTEPLQPLNEITLTNLGNGLVQVTSDIAGGAPGSGELSARTGDMMYIQPTSPFAIDIRCNSVGAGGVTPGNNPQYLGYPVVHVIDSNNIIVIAPNITTFGTTVLSLAEDLVFLPSVWNEKNIRTNHQEGSKFDEVINNNEMYYLIKTLGNGLVSVFLQNSSSEATDDALFAEMSVNTDDLASFSDGFDPSNQGVYKIVAHNGRNHMLIYNPAGGKDELVDADGDRKWRVGPINDGINRSLRIISSDSVQIGDQFRISTPGNNAQWFNGELIGSWSVAKIGYSAFNFTGSLPHSYTSGSADQSQICPYIDITIPNAPLSILDTVSAPVDSFLIGANDTAIGFTEGTPFNGFRLVEGYSVSPVDPELSDVFLVPKINTSKITSTFGTSVSVVGKIGYDQQAFQGIDGYKFHTGLVREAHRIIDGLPTNTVLYPGVKAAGAIVDVSTPLIKSVQIGISVKPKDGVTLNSISDLVKDSVAGYVNSLGVGQPVVASAIIRIVQGLAGVFSCSIVSTAPALDDDRIVVSENEKAFVLDQTTDITTG
jgi:Baseplate J-like protein